ncbi:MAG: aldehyde dehydrogenase [Pedosphaera parvula]|nr:aldehyde dehydrogenase [Pedosphaera parvula]
MLTEMDRVLAGLTRGLDLSALDGGQGMGGRGDASFQARADCFGAVLPSNSPGVHSLWLPVIPLKVPLAVKPGREEPWTPHRILQAFIRAGCPAEFLGFYPSDHAGAGEILRRCGRSMLFGDTSATRPYQDDPRIEIHGPGYSKILLDEDAAGKWEQHLDLMVTSILENGGRSCINASAVWTPRHGREIAEALAERLGSVPALPAEHPDARLAAFANPQTAERISTLIDQALGTPGAQDVTAGTRAGGRVVRLDGCAYLLPTLIRCETPDHPLANREFLFPYASVVSCPQAEMVERIGPTLVATAIIRDESFARALMASRDIDRLNLGPIPTCQVSWDQPHEGNLFEHLYRRRAFQLVDESASASALADSSILGNPSHGDFRSETRKPDIP